MLLLVVVNLLMSFVLDFFEAHCQSFPAKPTTTTHQGKCGRVHITISSLNNSLIELNWITNCNNAPPAVISLFNQNPTIVERLQPLESIQSSKYPSGFYKTSVKFQETILPGGWKYSDELTRATPGKHCFPYWIASFAENGTIIDCQCFAIQPTWMGDNKEHLLQKTLDNILIPGTHNSGAYDGSHLLLETFQNYLLNQDRLIWTQLVFGIRYLDLRVGYYENEGFYVNHALFRITPLKPVLQQIRKFMELTEEVVVVDFHRFPYPLDFGEELHAALTKMIYEELGEFALPRLANSEKLNFVGLWSSKKRLIIGYNTIQERPWLWDGITQFWANTVSIADLKNYLLDKLRRDSGRSRLWALMAELTPQIFDILQLKNNLRKLADDVNRELTKWFRDEWEGFSYNIVATDYFLGNDLINVAIEEIRS